MNSTIGIIGTGYVGLITAVGLAELGNYVTAADSDIRKIQELSAGKASIYEHGLVEYLEKNAQRISFSTNVPSTIADNDIIIIAVGTPMDEKGSADLRSINEVVHTLIQNLSAYKIIIVKSTVPVGTNHEIKRELEEAGKKEGTDFDIVSNPEFLREGNALEDFLYPDRIVVGCREHKGLRQNITDMYARLGSKIMFCTAPVAELSKYASNSFLASKITFINELANLSEVIGADIQEVTKIMGMDNRISDKFLNPGPGFGGSCFPKDTMALLRSANEHGVHLSIVDATIQANESQKERMVTKLLALLGIQPYQKNSLVGKIIAMWGLTFKPETDDVRESSAIEIVRQLLLLGAQLRVYDPQGMEAFADIFPNITYCDTALSAAEEANALIVHTEWDEFRTINIKTIGKFMREKILLDTRNIYDPQVMKEQGFTYQGVGR